jgi:hypothetical protein
MNDKEYTDAFGNKLILEGKYGYAITHNKIVSTGNGILKSVSKKGYGTIEIIAQYESTYTNPVTLKNPPAISTSLKANQLIPLQIKN